MKFVLSFILLSGLFMACSSGEETTRELGQNGSGNSGVEKSYHAEAELAIDISEQQKLKNSYRLAVLDKYDDPLTGITDYTFSYNSGWLDIWYGGDKLITFRDKVNRQELVEEYGFIESKLPDYREAVTLLRAVQLSKDGITLRVIDDPERSNANWISYIEIDSPDYRIADEFYVGMPVEDFMSLSAISYVDNEVHMRLGSGGLEYKFDYKSGSRDLEFLENLLIIKFDQDKLSRITYYIGDEILIP